MNLPECPGSLSFRSSHPSMSVITTILQVILLVFVVLTIFNIIIFVHELGHFWAAKWRGLQIDRFQIWFGKPIWKKEINGVQYGLGWIPAGGFVALPQMAPMEALEGGWTRSSSHLPDHFFQFCWLWWPQCSCGRSENLRTSFHRPK